MKLTAHQKTAVETAWHHSASRYIVNSKVFNRATIRKLIAYGLVGATVDMVGRHSLTETGAELRKTLKAQ